MPVMGLEYVNGWLLQLARIDSFAAGVVDLRLPLPSYCVRSRLVREE